METISALTNWRLTVRREESGVTILRAVTCDKRAVLPEAQSVLLLVMPYTPYRARPGEAEVDAYYIASNRHGTVRRTR